MEVEEEAIGGKQQHDGIITGGGSYQWRQRKKNKEKKNKKHNPNYNTTQQTKGGVGYIYVLPKANKERKRGRVQCCHFFNGVPINHSARWYLHGNRSLSMETKKKDKREKNEKITPIITLHNKQRRCI